MCTFQVRSGHLWNSLAPIIRTDLKSMSISEFKTCIYYFNLIIVFNYCITPSPRINRPPACRTALKIFPSPTATLAGPLKEVAVGAPS